MRDDFIEFTDASGRTTGEALAEIILARLTHHGLDISKLRRQGYDEASNMTGKDSGVKSRILAVYPRALFTHCSAHVLNLAVADSCQEANITKCSAV